MPEEDQAPATKLEAKDQVAASAVIEIQTSKDAQGTLRPFPITPSEALLEIEVSGVRGNSMTMLRTMVSMSEASYKESKLRVAALEDRIELLKNEFHEKDKTVAVLQSELDNVGKLKLLQNVLLTAGGIINGVGVKYLIDGKIPGFVALGVGCLLLIAGWLWPLGAKRKL